MTSSFLNEYIKRLIESELRNIQEGGWTSLKTQNTKLSPMVLKSADKFTKELISNFNKWLKSDSPNAPGLNPVRPVGSGIYYEKDIEEDPEKIYGDIDYLIEYPVLMDFAPDDKKKSEAESVKFYNKKLFEFFDDTKPNGVVIEDSKGRDGGTAVVIAEVESDKYVQIDFVATHKEYSTWAKARFTPIRNIKGFVSGGVYASLAEALLLSIGDKGIRGKLSNGILVPYSKRKNTEEVVVSLSMDSFFNDLVKFFARLKGIGEPKVMPEDIIGIDPNNLSLKNMAAGIKSLGIALERNGIFDGEQIKYTSAQEFYQAVANAFSKKMEKVLNNPKFKKAETEKAMAARDKIFKMASDAREEFLSYLL